MGSPTDMSARTYRVFESDATDDRTAGGRWVATDESGWNGERILGADTDRFLVIGSVAVDDLRALKIVESLRAAAGICQAGELKFSHFRRNPRRLGVLADALRDPRLLADRVSVYFVDKPYMVAGKIVDLLIEEYANDNGLRFMPEQLRGMARTLAIAGSAALGEDRYAALLHSMMVFASAGNVMGARMKTAEFMRQVREARDACAPGPVQDILSLAAKAGRQAADLLAPGLASTKNIEPLIPGLPVIAGWWMDQFHGPVRLLADEQIELTDHVLELTALAAGVALDGSRSKVRSRSHGAVISRGRSIDHLSIQLADLVAGAGLAVSRDEVDGTVKLPSDLKAAIMDRMNPQSLLPHDEVGRLL